MKVTRVFCEIGHQCKFNKHFLVFMTKSTSNHEKQVSICNHSVVDVKGDP